MYRIVIKLLCAMIIFTATFSLNTSFVEGKILHEDIIFAINQDFADTHPDWKTHAQEIIEFVNAIFAKNTSIQYRIVEFKTFKIDEYKQKVHDDRSFYHVIDNGSSAFATTIFYFQATKETEGLVSELSGSYNPRAFAELLGENPDSLLNKPIKRHAIHFFASSDARFERESPIFGRELLNNNHGAGAFEESASTFIHELGHTFGLAGIEYYFFNENYDFSGVEPTLPARVGAQVYGKDPMLGNFGMASRFTDLHASIINENSSHEKTVVNTDYYKDQSSTKVRVVVVDEDNKPIANAPVKVFGSRTTCRACFKDPSVNGQKSPLLEEGYTNQQGELYIEPTVNFWRASEEGGRLNEWLTKVVKVYDGKRGQGTYVNTVDLQINKRLKGSDVYDLTFMFPKKGANDEVLSYRNPVTKRTIKVTKANAFNVLQKQASVISKQSLALITEKRTSVSLKTAKKFEGRFVKTTADKKRIWYIQKKTLNVAYLDTTRQSHNYIYNLLTMEGKQK